MKLLEQYSLTTGLKIGQQFLHESFYPLPYDKYIILFAGSGMPGKNYSYYEEVLSLLQPVLSKENIQVVQLGGKDDLPVKNCHHLMGQTSLHQSAFLLRRALCLISNDSWMAHRAGEIGVPMVVLYGPTSVANHSPYKYDPAKTIFLESHRGGKRPSFASQESPKTIDYIQPETVAQSAAKLLGLSCPVRETLYIGNSFNQKLIELVPNVVVDPKIQIFGAMVVRMDLHHDEKIMLANLQMRKCVLSLNKEINLNAVLPLKQNLVSLRVQVDNISGPWLRMAKKLGVPISFVSHEQDAEKLSALRLKLYDFCFFDHYKPLTKDDFLKDSAKYLNKEIDKNLNVSTLQFKINRMILSDGKIYLSHAHRIMGLVTPSTEINTGQVIDESLFWEDLDHMLIFK